MMFKWAGMFLLLWCGVGYIFNCLTDQPETEEECYYD